jgi:hypothetical protein
MRIFDKNIQLDIELTRKHYFNNAYSFIKGGMRIMGYLWVMTIGYVICLGLLGGTLMFFITSAFDFDDASRIDLLDTKEKE